MNNRKVSIGMLRPRSWLIWGYSRDWYTKEKFAKFLRIFVYNITTYEKKKAKVEWSVVKQNIIKPGRYRHYKGNEYEVIGVGSHSETLEAMVVYRPLYGEGGLWVRPAAMWDEIIEKDGITIKRFEYIGEASLKKDEL